MYQLLSLKEGKEYLLDTETYNLDFLEDPSEWDSAEYIEQKPIFTTLLDYLNIDFEREARNSFIDIVCGASCNYHMLYDISEEVWQATKEYRCDRLLEFLYCLFPNDKKKRKISKIKTRRRAGMTINQQFEEKAIQHYIKRFETRYRDGCDEYNCCNRIDYNNIIWLRDYIDRMKNNELLRLPSVFKSFIDGASEQYHIRKDIREDIVIYEAVPYISKRARVFKTIDEFIKTMNISYKKKGFDQYLINTHSDAFRDYSRKGRIDLVCSDIYFLLQQGKTIVKCANCGKYFIPQARTDSIYCQNPAPLDIRKTCREYAATRGYYLEQKNNEVENLRRKIKDRLNKRAQRYDYEQLPYNQFREYDKSFRTQIKNGTISNVEYIAWLKKVDEITLNNIRTPDEMKPDFLK